MRKFEVVIRASGAHAHLSDGDVEALFGPGAKLNVVKMLGDGKAGQYLSDKKVEILCGGKSRRLSVLGPTRRHAQVELSYTEARALGIRPPIGDSGRLEGTMGCVLAGPAGQVTLAEGVMTPRRHVHLNVEHAKSLGLEDGAFVNVLTEGPRGLVFHMVIVRVGHGSTVMHVDYDEMNAAGLVGDAKGFILLE